MSKKHHTNPNYRPSIQTVQERSLSYQGPLPLPKFMEDYERICPGSADRIITLAENQAEHRMKLETLVVNSNVKNENKGMWMAFAIAMAAVLGGVVVILFDKSAEGISIIITSLVALVGVFIYGRRAQAKERKEKNLQ